METAIKIVEIFAFLSGLVYIVLELKQKDFMWYIGIATGIACAFSFAVQKLWASAGLNLYYVGISFWGILQWKKDKNAISNGKSEIHLNKISLKILLGSVLCFVFCSVLLIVILRFVGDGESELDAVITVMSAIAAFWLAKSYPEQWLIWFVADVLSAVMCLKSGMYWMAFLYMAYAAAAVYGYFYWRKKGIYL